MVGELAAPEIDTEGRRVAGLPKCQAERRRKRRLLASEPDRHCGERQRVQALRRRSERTSEGRDRPRRVRGITADPERRQGLTVSERQERPANLAQATLEIAGADARAEHAETREATVGEQRHRRARGIEADERQPSRTCGGRFPHHVQGREACKIDQARIDAGFGEGGQVLAHRDLRRRHREHVAAAVRLRPEHLIVDHRLIELEGEMRFELERHRLVESFPIVERQLEDAMRGGVAGHGRHDLVPGDAMLDGERAQVGRQVAAGPAGVGVQAEDALAPQRPLHQGGPEHLRADVERERVIRHPVSCRPATATWRENRKGVGMSRRGSCCWASR